MYQILHKSSTNSDPKNLNDIIVSLQFSFFSSMKILQRPETIFLLFQIKLCGICCLASAVLCVVVTVTTTVIHMNRLQTLRECVYQGSIQTCTCFAGFFDPTMSHHDGNNNNWTWVGDCSAQ